MFSKFFKILMEVLTCYFAKEFFSENDLTNSDT
jgi:hypothetical protein